MFDAVTIMVTTEETAFGLQIWDIGFVKDKNTYISVNFYIS